MTDSLRDLQKEFPQFAIWQEITGERTRYIALRAQAGANPHTVVTADLAELRTILREGTGHSQQPPAQPAGTAAPNIARMYSFWQGGKDHLAADRAAAGGVSAQFPEVARIARANRAFVTRAVAHVAAQGVGQFVDIGAGLPAWPAVHQIAHEHAPAATVVYVDNDEVVLAHARALLAAGPNITVAEGDLRDPGGILAHPVLRTVIDFDQPVCLLLAAVLRFLEPAEADHAVRVLAGALTSGSYLVISAGTSTGTDPALLARLRTAYAGAATITARTEEDIAAWFTGYALEPPGLVDVRDWRARRTRPAPAATCRPVPGRSRPQIPAAAVTLTAFIRQAELAATQAGPPPPTAPVESAAGLPGSGIDARSARLPHHAR